MGECMKKLKLIFTVFCICLLLIPTAAFATERTSDYFTVILDIGHHESIGPGDVFSDTFTVNNTTRKPIRVRVYQVQNRDDSVLYPVLQAGWVSQDGEVNYGSFDNLVTDWYDIPVGGSLNLPLSVYFPSNYGNEFEDATLAAEFTFETRVPDDEVRPDTGDGFNLIFWGGMAVGSAAVMIILILNGKRSKKEK